MKVKIAAKKSTIGDNSVLQYSKKTQRVTYTQWLFTYPVFRQHKSESIGVFGPTSVEDPLCLFWITSASINGCKYFT